MISLHGCPNFRDLGGHRTADGRRVRSGRVFRSDGLHALTDADVGELREVGVVTVFDLRTPAEIDEHGVGPLYDGEGAARHVPAPLFQATPEHWQDRDEPYTADRVGRQYFEMLQLGADSIARIARDLGADSNLPAVFHCMAGRDRTGVVAAVLLSTLGVPVDAIAADYARTGEFIPEPEIVHGAIESLLARVEREHGSAPAYLRAVGVTDEQVASLRRSLLE